MLGPGLNDLAATAGLLVLLASPVAFDRFTGAGASCLFIIAKLLFAGSLLKLLAATLSTLGMANAAITSTAAERSRRQTLWREVLAAALRTAISIGMMPGHHMRTDRAGVR